MALTRDVPLWENGIIPYDFSRELISGYRKYIREAMDHIQKETDITFRRKNTRTEDYIVFEHGDDCSSEIGCLGGEQVVSLGEGCFAFGTLVHELMHVLGFQHEQCRYDRDNYVVYYENIPRGWRSQYKKIAYRGQIGEFDYNSIMLYGSQKFCDDCTVSMTRVNGNMLREVHNKPGLSAHDVTKIQFLYQEEFYESS